MLVWHRLPEDAGNVPALVCLHGFLGSARDWLPLAQGLHPLGPLLCLDLPGHGDSARIPWESWEDFTEAIAADLRQKEWPPVPLLGYSMGGRIALHLALTYPKLFSALIIEGASPGLRAEEDRRQRYLRDLKLAAQLETCLGKGQEDTFREFLQGWYQQPLFATLWQNAEALQHLIERRLANPPPAPGAALRLLSVGAQPILWEQLSSLEIPCLAIVGEEDRKYRLIGEAMSEMCPRMALEVFANCSHNVHLENPGSYTTVVKRFVQALG